MTCVLFLIEDVPFSIDSRVQREVDTLKKFGVETVVICPVTSSHEPSYYQKKGVHIYQYCIKVQGKGIFAHICEYLVSLAWQTYLAAKINFKHRFSAIHIGNHSDLFWIVALPYKLTGKLIIYDQHDPIPELFDVRFGQRAPILGRIIRLFEKINIALADHVITINESCRDSVLRKVKKRHDQVTIVRNGPRKRDFDISKTDQYLKIRALGRIVVGYLGHMNPQDNLEVFIEIARIIRNEKGRTDIGFVMIGSGTDWHRLKAMRDRLGLSDAVYMPGRLPWDCVLSYMNAADICIQPDLPNAFNHKVTMNKLMEYMMLGKPTVTFDLIETKISGGNAVVYCEEATAACMAKHVIALADNADRRIKIGKAGRKRIDGKLGWQHQERALLSTYSALFPELMGRGELK